MITFFGDPTIKEKYLKQLQEHYENDEIIKGKYWENGKGCAVGCLVHSNRHSDFEKLFGLPEWLAHLVDVVFESLPNQKAKEFSARWFKAVPISVDLTKTKHKLSIFLLTEICKNTDHVSVKKQIDTIITLHQRCIEKGHKSVTSASESVVVSARLAVRAAAWSAAWSAAWVSISEKLIHLLEESK